MTQQAIWQDNHLINPRLSPEECGDKVFDELTATSRLKIQQLADRTELSRGQVASGIRSLRDTLGEEALVCNRDHTYELAMQPATVSDYRNRRLVFIVHSLERLHRILKAGVTKFSGDEDTIVAIELLGSAISLLRRGARVQPEPRTEEGFAELVT